MTKEEILKQINILDTWFNDNDYRGYDPYDLFDTKLFHSLIDIKYKLLRKVNRKFISWFIFLFPSLVIKIFNKKPNINAKAMGLLLKAKCNMYEVTNDDKYLKGAVEISEWLIKNRTKDLNGFGWGYPFDWSGSLFIPKHTPSSVVSTVVGDGFYSLYKITNNSAYLDVCKKICIFLTSDLNIDYINRDSICFSYTPIDNDHVLNANLFTAEYLVRIGFEIQNRSYIDLGKKALNYTLKQQKQSGDFSYWGQEDKKKLRFSLSNSDHYHTGFELRMLFNLWVLLKDNKIKYALDKYYNFYIENFINNDFSINIFPKRKYPINIHACSEVLLCNSIISSTYKSSKVDLGKIYSWINSIMLGDKGLYNYEIRNVFGLKFKNNFKFHRWSQAWMLLALTEYIKLEEVNDD